MITWVNELGWLAPVYFIIIYCFATILFLPTMILTFTGGAFFGPLLGTLFNLLGASLGACLSFLISRHLLFDWFTKKRSGKINTLVTGVEQKGWIFVALLRLFPIIPFNLVNYGMGVTKIKFRIYMLATVVFLIPAEIFYTYCGYAGMDALAKSGHFYRNGGIFLLGLTLVLLTIFILFKIKQIKYSKKMAHLNHFNSVKLND
ncbi:MAG: TVP38/TMEM64 family protein [bacterium]|nr:TVP38/TMEM64 family protein [bacterium]